MELSNFVFLNPPPDYYWFYSSLSQSLAALIGVIGMFIVYRLQIQQDYIRDLIVKMQKFFVIGKQDAFGYLTEEETVEEARKNVSILEIEKKEKEEELQRPESEHQNDAGIVVFKSRIDRARDHLNEINQKLNGWKSRLKQYDLNNEKRETIKIAGFVTVCYLIFCFFSSMILLSFAEYFKDKYFDGLVWFWRAILGLCLGMFFLVVCMYISFSEKKFHGNSS